MPQLTWPWVVLLCAALFAVFLLASTVLGRRQTNGTRPRPRHSASTTVHVLPRPTLPQKVITQATGHPPWEVNQDTSPTLTGSSPSWPPLSRRNSERRMFEEELDSAFLTAPLPAPDLEPLPEVPWWAIETPSMMRPPKGGSMILSVRKPPEMLVTHQPRPDLVVPAGQMHWRASTTPKAVIRTIKTTERWELVLY